MAYGSNISNAASNSPIGDIFFGGRGNVISSERHTPYRNFRFEVMVDGVVAVGGFSKISGLKEESDIIEYREGNWVFGITPDKLPGLIRYDDVVLETGFSSDNTLIHWRQAAAGMGTLSTGVANDGDPVQHRGSLFGIIPFPGIDLLDFRKTVHITIFKKGDPAVPGRTLVLFRAWPRALEISPLDGRGSEIIIESLTLAHTGMAWSDEIDWKDVARSIGRSLAGQVGSAFL